MRTVTTLLLLAAVSAPAFAQRPPTGWGPSWVGSKPPGGFDRPTDLKSHATAVSVLGSGFAVEATVWGDVESLQKGHEYELRYQLRVHTKKGETGPLLGTDAVPGGIAPVVAKGKGGADWWGLEGAVDITRKELSGMTNLPEIKDGWDQTVFLRVEPQLYDVTEKKYLTDPKTRAAMLAVSVGKNRKVYRITPLGEWVADNAKHNSNKVVALLAELDVLDHPACGIAAVLLPTLTDKDTKREVKLNLVAALPPEAVIDRKSNYPFCQLMEDWMTGDDTGLKAVAKKVLGEK